MRHTTYCWNCFEQKVAPAKESYLEIMRRARQVYIFRKKEKEIPLIRREKVLLTVKDCADQKETILRLAFKAAERNMNAVVQVEENVKTVRVGGYQKSSWSATGFPAEIRVAGLRVDPYDRGR